MANMTSRAQATLRLRKAVKVERENGTMLVTILGLKHELETKNNAMRRLELAIQQRNETIDTLNHKLEQSRQQCRRLDAEAERYFQMLAAG
jgi:hypothetical protein